ncbi:MAG: rRNA maturation RNase YbeY [Candidatus Omnitrophica bacterium]|nr:rRNA maturation RNase YbeY [Candidatus Omnitrophota bacterium]
MTITIQNQQAQIYVPKTKVKRIIQKILKHEARYLSSAEISITFVNDRHIRKLNHHFHNRDEATDVLAFDLSVQKDKLIADIYISTQTALRQAKMWGNSPRKEILLYVIHAILHLVGYDDNLPSLSAKMRRKEAYYLESLS